MKHFRLLAAGLIGFATLLAVIWALYVPIFQAPDEELHLDYAFSLMTAGHLLSVRDRPPEPEPLGQSNPYTAYLVNRTAFSAIAHRSAVKAPADYGSPSYYGELNSHAPSAAAAAIQARNPFLLARYPFGYYALLGGWLSLLRGLGINLVGLVFGARLLSTAMLGASLLLALKTLRELNAPPGQALILIGVAGVIPLTTFVAASIQPDNLGALLVYLAIYLALVLCRTESLRVGWGLGAALGLLLVTKYQFFLCTATPIALFLATRSRPGRFLRAHYVGALVVPVVLLAAVQMWITWGGTTPVLLAQAQPLEWSYAALKGAAAAGPGSLASYAARTVGQAFGDFYGLGGQTFDSYWGTFGWLDSPLVIVNQPVQTVVDGVIAFATLFFGALAIVRMVLAGRRLGRIWLRGRRRIALRLVAGNPLLNAYIAFTGFMFVLYVMTNDTIGAQGRNWVPFVIPAFWLCLISAASGLKTKRKRVATRRVLAAGLVAYAVAGSLFGVRAIHDRYYGNGRGLVSVKVDSLRRLQGNATVHVDYMIPSDRVPSLIGTVVPPGGYVAVGGWAAETARGRPAATLIITVDGDQSYEAVYGDDSPAAVRYLGSSAYRRAGFDIIVPARGLQPGVHYLTFKVVPQELNGFIATSQRLPFRVG